MTSDEKNAGVPRWVKVSAIVAAVLALLVFAVLLISGGEHGPARHMSAGHGGLPGTAEVRA